MKYKTLIHGIFNLVVRRYAGPFWYRRRWLAKTQWMDEMELNKIQLRLLQNLINHCYKTIPFYRNIMNSEGLKATSIKSLTDIEKFPVLTKKEVLNAGKQIVSKKYFPFLRHTAYTGGTTGTPMPIQRDLLSIGNEHAFVRRQWDWAGLKITDRCAYLTGRLIANTNSSTAKLYSYDPFMKELILSTYHLSESTAIYYIDIMKQYNVKAIVGYPSAIFLLAKVCLKHGIEMKLQSVLTSSETLTSLMRPTIEDAFKCPIYDFYGSAERVCYIFTCEKGNYHINPEYGYTELIPVDKTNPQRCKVIATGFWNKSMPLVRYDTGDIVLRSEEKCLCGRSFPIIESIEGRLADSIKTPSGKELGPAILTHLLYGTNNILESQLIQEQIGTLYIDYVPTKKFSEKDLDKFQALATEYIPDELSVVFREVNQIKRTKSGKIKPVISNIK